MRLAKIKIRRQQTTTAVRIERDNIAQLRLSIVDRELRVAQDRSAKRSQLTKLQKTLAHEATVLDREAAVARDASLPVAPPTGGCVNTPYVPHGGSTGFFPASGTNYTVNQEPIIAARLDALGKALGLHLIGISGYPQPLHHSVGVRPGFADALTPTPAARPPTHPVSKACPRPRSRSSASRAPSQGHTRQIQGYRPRSVVAEERGRQFAPRHLVRPR